MFVMNSSFPPKLSGPSSGLCSTLLDPNVVDRRFPSPHQDVLFSPIIRPPLFVDSPELLKAPTLSPQASLPLPSWWKISSGDRRRRPFLSFGIPCFRIQNLENALFPSLTRDRFRLPARADRGFPFPPLFFHLVGKIPSILSACSAILDPILTVFS